MRLVVVADSEAVGREGAHLVAAQLRRNPASVLGLATGSTMVPFYRELVRLHCEEQLDFSQVRVFMLDEYRGLAPEDPRSFHWFMREHLFRHVNLAPRHIHLPNGLARDARDECVRYEEEIAEAGGIDLQVLGIGVNGHIAFNEPGTPFEAATRCVRLEAGTVRRNQALSRSIRPLPDTAISLGIKTIMHARRLLLVASGPEKATAVAAALEGPVTADLPASALQLHPDLTVVLDPAAAAGLRSS